MADTEYIRIIFADYLHNQFISLGQARYGSPQALDAAWGQLAAGDEDSDFMAERLNPSGMVVDEKTITAAAVAVCFGRAVQQVIADARRQHARMAQMCQPVAARWPV